MKGSGEIVNAILLIVFMLGVASVLIATVVGYDYKGKNIIFSETSLVTAKNTFFLVNKSLETTWFVSTVQLIYGASDSKLSCPSDYWYRYDVGDYKTAKCVDMDIDGCVSSGPRIPEGIENPAGYNPKICIPGTAQVTDFFNENVPQYHAIKNAFSVNGLSIGIGNIQTSFAPEDERIFSSTSSDLRVSLGKQTKIAATVKNDVTINTEFIKMLKAWRSAVQEILGLSDKLVKERLQGVPDDSYDYSLRYQDMLASSVGSVPETNYASYEVRIKKYIEERMKKVQEDTGMKKSAILVSYKTLELLVPSNEQIKVWGIAGLTNPNRGLVLHYDANIEITEIGGVGKTDQCIAPNEAYVNYIEAAVDRYDWDFGDVSYEKEDMIMLMKGLIQRESSWIPDAFSSAGAIGLMQIMPATGLGECNEFILTESDLYDPEKNVNCGVKYMRGLLYSYRDKDDKDNVIKLALAAYNGGIGRVDNAIDLAASSIYENVAPYLPLETQVYVPAVLGHYICYGGFVVSGTYYYHDEKNNQFIQKPFSVAISVEDYLPAIECDEEPYENTPYVREFSWEKPVDMLCCRSGVPNGSPNDPLLVTCNVDIPGIGNARLETSQLMGCPTPSGNIQYACTDAGFVLVPPAA